MYQIHGKPGMIFNIPAGGLKRHGRFFRFSNRAFILNFVKTPVMNEPQGNKITVREAIVKASEICSRSEKCRGDIAEKCREWHLSGEETREVTDWLVREKFIDHGRYATSFVRDKFRFNQWGKIKIAYALRQKQVEEVFIREALDSLPEEEYTEVLHKLLESKARTVKGGDAYTRRGKLLTFVMGRGFETELAGRILSGMKY